MENQGVPNPTADDLLREASIIGTNTNATGFKTKVLLLLHKHQQSHLV